MVKGVPATEAELLGGGSCVSEISGDGDCAKKAEGAMVKTKMNIPTFHPGPFWNRQTFLPGKYNSLVFMRHLAISDGQARALCLFSAILTSNSSAHFGTIQPSTEFLNFF
jgi:hypothetical protein